MEMSNSLINDRYRIEEEVGSGGMADVYRAFDVVSGRFVAIKLIKSEYCLDPDYVERFEKEAQTALKLHCRNIVSTYDYGSFEDANGVSRRYIAFEYVNGCILKESIAAQGSVSAKVAANIACSILDALECVHNAGYIHRDVKPQNVLISTDKTIKLTDFGIAQAVCADPMTCGSDDLVGSVHYISPEQTNGEPATVSSDIYSVGILLYEMLIGKPPFDGDDPMQIAVQHVIGSIVPPMEINPQIPPSISDVVIKATAKKPSDRFRSAQEMRIAIKRALLHPNRRIALTNEENGNEKRKSKLRHVIIPVVAAVALTVVAFFIWYFAVAQNDPSHNYSKVPSLLGKTQSEAEQLLAGRELELIIIGSAYSDYPEGTICVQEPEPGASLEKNSKIGVTISLGSDSVPMINICGMTLSEAEEALNKIGLKLGSVSYVEDSESLPNTVISQSVNTDVELVLGDEIDVEVSRSSKGD